MTIGLNNALAELVDSCGLDLGRVEGKYASSSAAGGLKMAAIGLVPELTLEAARRACLGAGAKVVCSYGFEIDKEVVREIESARCDIILLCGGTDGGDKRVITHNARMLAHSGVECPILVAGNRVVADTIRETLERRGQEGLQGQQRAAHPRHGRGGAGAGADPRDLHSPHHPRERPRQGG